MKTTTQASLLFPLALTSAHALAQSTSTLDARTESRLLRQELLHVERRSTAGGDRFALAAPSTVQKSLSVGAAYTDGDGYSTWDTPLVLAFSFPSGWRLSMSTLGYEKTDFDDDSKADGWTDVKFKGAYVFKFENGSLSAGLAARAPSGGEVGSKHWQQEFSLSYRGTAGATSFSIAGALKHNSGDQPPGVSAYPRYVALSLGRDLGEDRTISFQVDRLLIPGRAGAATAGFSFDFPIEASGTALAGTLSLTKGISSSDRSTSVGFDLGYSF